MHLMQTRRERLTIKQQRKLQEYLGLQPVIAAMYNFAQNLNNLLRLKAQNPRNSEQHVADLLENTG